MSLWLGPEVQALPREAELIQNRRLPPFYAITAPLEADGSDTPILEQAACRKWLAHFERLLARDIELIQLRAKALSRADLIEIATHCHNLAKRCRSGSGGENRHDERPEESESGSEAVARVAATSGVRLLLNGPPDIVLALGMAGMHLTSAALAEFEQRPLPERFLVAASCHSPEELARAQTLGANFACLSPLRVTKGYSSEDALGFDRFAEWVSACEIPVYGLGGLGREDLETVQEAGGQGVAGISAFWH